MKTSGSGHRLVRHGQTQRIHIILGVALVAQVACWLLATPGPFLRSGSLSIESASSSVFTTFAILFVFPFLTSKFLVGANQIELGMGLGKWKAGLTILGVSVPIAACLLYFSSDDAEILAAFPWPGKWLSLSLVNMIHWFAIYSIYYFAFEYFYRAFLLRGLESELGLATAMWIQVLLSVSIHFGKPTPELLGSIPAGFLFGWIAWRTRSIWYVFALHWIIGILNDIFAMHFHGWLRS